MISFSFITLTLFIGFIFMVLCNIIIHKIWPSCIMKTPLSLMFSIGTNSLKAFPKFALVKNDFSHVRPRIYNKKGKLENVKFAGLKIIIGFGTWRRPIAKFYKKDFWSKDARVKSYYNAWNSGNHWFILTFPFMPYIFISTVLFSYKKYHPGFYFGGRTCEMSDWSFYLLDNTKYDKDGNLPSPRPWIRDANGNIVLAWGSWKEKGNVYVEPTATIRKDMLYS